MGTKILPRIPGADCWLWDPANETPSIIYAMIWLVETGTRGGARTPPNGHIFKCEQVPGHPCLWRYENVDYGWFVEIGIDGANTWLWVRDTVLPAKYYFAHTKAVFPPSDFEIFTNVYQVALNNWGYGGWGTIFWMDKVIEKLEDLVLDEMTPVFMELFGDEQPELFLKFACQPYAMNIVIELS